MFRKNQKRSGYNWKMFIINFGPHLHPDFMNILIYFVNLFNIQKNDTIINPGLLTSTHFYFIFNQFFLGIKS